MYEPVASTEPAAGEQLWAPVAWAALTVQRTVATRVDVLVAVMVTDPVGVPALVGVGVSVGVRSTVFSCPRATDVGETASVVAVDAWVTVRNPNVDDAEKLVSPAYVDTTV